MSYSKQPIPFRARYDYGPRPKSEYPTLAVLWHMAEGTDVAQFLSRRPARGVSVHYTIEQKTDTWKDGQVVRCLPENRISGSLDPERVRKSTDPGGYYGAKHARAALGKWHRNPNVVMVTVEVAGWAAKGPTKAQVVSMVALFEDIRRRRQRVVPLAHRDFADYKGCPGRSYRMKRAFSRMGGHGLDFEAPGKPPIEPPIEPDDDLEAALKRIVELELEQAILLRTIDSIDELIAPHVGG